MRLSFSVLCMTFCVIAGHAQNFHGQQEKELDEFRKAVFEDFGSFRKQCLKDFADFVRNSWKAFEKTQPVPVPEDKTVPPLVMPKEEEDTLIAIRPVVIEEVVPTVPIDVQPQPLEPVKEVPVAEEKMVEFTFFGTTAKVRFDVSRLVKVNRVDENSIADAMGNFTGADYDNLLIDCLSLRERLRLCDWAYLQMLKSLTETIAANNTNDATLLLAYLYMQSGYKMRLASDGAKLYMLFASKHKIYNRVSYKVDGETYYGVEKLPERLYVCQAAYPKEKGLSLIVSDSPLLTEDRSSQRTIVSEKYPEVTVTVSVNRNLLDFYSSYPSSMIGNNSLSRWAMYANTPLSQSLKEQLYPALKAQLSNLSQRDAANRLLNLVQTGLVYGYDEKVWGQDRAFFAEESLFYPYCDCEDRSILYTRLVRDLLGLDCLLVYYPGHLATAVGFTEDVRGDFIALGDKRFVVADPTYIGASVGLTMPDMDNLSAKVIKLRCPAERR